MILTGGVLGEGLDVRHALVDKLPCTHVQLIWGADQFH